MPEQHEAQKTGNPVIMGFESTCDDTGVAILDNNEKILSNRIYSQMKTHLWNGGIIPMLAKEFHVREIDGVAQAAFRESKLTSVSQDVSAIAVSNRPGMFHSIEVGLNYARTLAKKHSKPLIPIHHMQAHALMPLLTNKQIRFPFLALLISGGHCILAIAKTFNQFDILGQTQDDAPGDLLDKFARRTRLRNLGPPFDGLCGGAAVELLAKQGDRFRYFNENIRVPTFKIRTCNFSFSGYRGSYEAYMPMIDELWLSGDRDRLIRELSDLSASLQRIILIQLVRRIQRADDYFRMFWRYDNPDFFSSADKTEHLGFKLLRQDYHMHDDSIDLVVSGGVAANSYLTRSLTEVFRDTPDNNMNVFTPRAGLCNDNGLMIAWNGLLHYRNYIANNDLTSICLDDQSMDEICADQEEPMGQDIIKKVHLVDFKTVTPKHPELKLDK